MIKFCKEKVLEILAKLKPKYIVAEGFITYDRLKDLLGANEEDKINENIRKCKTDCQIPLIGITHPTGTRRKGIGSINKMLTDIGFKLKEIIKK